MLALLFRLRPASLRRGVLALCILVGAAGNWSALASYRSVLPSNLCYFLVGFLLADLRITSRPALRHPLWDAAKLLLWPAFFLLPDGRWSTILLCLLLFTGVTAAMSGPPGTTHAQLEAGRHHRRGCYSIYLLHMLVLSMLFPATRHALVSSHLWVNYLVQMLLLVPCAIAFSMVYYVLIERPCMDPHWPAHLWRQLSGQQHADTFMTE